ncbi:zinc ribbon domain-containing protein [Polyangium fumosum]|uniref:Zinc ribbon domain-containing protein n=1 Tax=Polyangium fumosum TaxID=889272 RepID=A0A4U1IQG6_9BACT|nr:zinc ribbon domain-containing protein [Polyangium fumosum]TKC96457.1 zinc ribbon domain-containing protein [Polyangium fumosum]
MSSETSTDKRAADKRDRGLGDAAPRAGAEPSNVDQELERKIADAVKFGVPAVTAILALLGGMFVDVPTAILVLAAGVLVTVIASFWASLRTLLGETPLSGADAYAIGAPPRAEEEQKRAVIRALKDLEFERSVGKISEEDYRALVAKYRAEAKRLLRALDQNAAPGRERAEVLVQRRLKQLGLLDGEKEETDEDDEAGDAAEAAEAPAPKAEAKAAPEPAAAKEEADEASKKPKKKKKAKAPAKATSDEAAAQHACDACGTENDEDALFCKKCGARMAAPEPAEETREAKKADEGAEAS